MLSSNILDRRLQWGLSFQSLNSQQILCDQLLHQVSDGLSDPYNLIAMGTAPLLGKWTKIKTLGFAEKFLGTQAKHFSRWAVKGLGTGLSFGVEVAAYEGLQRGLKVGLAGEDPALLSWSHFKSGFAHSALNFAFLKSANALSPQGNILLAHFSVDAAIVGAHAVARHLGMLPSTSESLLEQWLRAEVMNLQMQGGIALLNLANPRLALSEKVAQVLAQSFQPQSSTNFFKISEIPSMASSQASLERLEAKFESCKKSQRRDPVGMGTIAQIGRECIQKGCYDLAIRIFKWLNKHNEHAGNYGGLGEAYYHLGRYEEAVWAFRRALRMQAHFPIPLYLLAKILFERGDLDPAETYIRSLITIRHWAIDHSLLAQILMKKGQLQEAENSCRKAISIQPHPSHFLILGKLLSQQGKYSEATEAYEMGIRLNPYHPGFYSLLAYCYRKLHQHSQAVAITHRGISVGAKSPEVFVEKGFNLLALGKFNEAEQSMREAIRLYPNHGNIHTVLGIALLKQGKFKEAEPVFGIALVKSKPGFLLYNSLVKLFSQMPDREAEAAEARRMLAELRKTPGNAEDSFAEPEI